MAESRWDSRRGDGARHDLGDSRRENVDRPSSGVSGWGTWPMPISAIAVHVGIPGGEFPCAGTTKSEKENRSSPPHDALLIDVHPLFPLPNTKGVVPPSIARPLSEWGHRRKPVNAPTPRQFPSPTPRALCPTARGYAVSGVTPGMGTTIPPTTKWLCRGIERVASPFPISVRPPPFAVLPPPHPIRVYPRPFAVPLGTSFAQRPPAQVVSALTVASRLGMSATFRT